MRKFIIVLFLIFSLQSLTKADDIGDYEIEGISIGDSLLDYFSETEILQTYAGIYPNKKYFQVDINDGSKFEEYQKMQFHVINNDNKYRVHALSGEITFDNIDSCLSKKKEIFYIFKDVIKDAEIHDLGKREHVVDKSGESVSYDVYFWFKDDSVIGISCYDWSAKAVKEFNTIDNHLQVTLMNVEFATWIKGPAFKE